MRIEKHVGIRDYLETVQAEEKEDEHRGDPMPDDIKDDGQYQKRNEQHLFLICLASFVKKCLHFSELHAAEIPPAPSGRGKGLLRRLPAAARTFPLLVEEKGGIQHE